GGGGGDGGGGVGGGGGGGGGGGDGDGDGDDDISVKTLKRGHLIADANTLFPSRQKGSNPSHYSGAYIQFL
ncbi:Hypothetical predicted protein, partial [Paramuricea clavata]